MPPRKSARATKKDRLVKTTVKVTQDATVEEVKETLRTESSVQNNTNDENTTDVTMTETITTKIKPNIEEPASTTKEIKQKQKEQTSSTKEIEPTQAEQSLTTEDIEAKQEQSSATETVTKETEPEQEEQSSTATKRKHEESTGSSLADKMAKLKELKRRRATEVEQGNRKDRNLEFQRTKENPKLEVKNGRKKAEALKLLEKQEAQDAGEDYERKQFWKYSAESAAAWEKKMAKKAKMANNGFTDHSQAAHKKYIRLMSEFKPDMSAYSEKKLADIERAIRNGEDPSDISAMANSLDYARLDDKPSEEAVNRLAAETKKQIIQRETRSRDRKEESDDISWINEKNRVFNQKIARFYDKYTKEIRENLERGTAL